MLQTHYLEMISNKLIDSSKDLRMYNIYICVDEMQYSLSEIVKERKKTIIIPSLKVV